MQTLSTNWFAEGTIDFEYKQYVLLAYLAEMQRQFAHTRLYPPLADLIGHYRNLVAYRDRKSDLAGRFPQDLTGVDLAHLRLAYQPRVPEPELMQEIDDIVAYALPRIRQQVEAGRELYDIVDTQLLVLPVGVLPLYRDEGYVLLRRGTEADIQVYQYHIAHLQQGPERARGIHLQYLTQFTWSLASTYAHMKRDLIRANAALPNPATYAVESELAVPVAETLLPIAKRRLLRVVYEAG